MYKMKDILNRVKAITEKHKILPKHSDFQIEHFMIGKEYTNHSRLWQCVRELQTRQESLENIEVEIEQTKDNIELQKLKIQKLKIRLPKSSVLEIKFIEQKEIDIHIRKKERVLNNLEKTLEKIEDRKTILAEESAKILEIFESISKKTQFLDWNNEKAQEEYWNTKFKYELNIVSLLGHPVSSELAKSIMSLPDESLLKKQFGSALINNQKKLTEKNN